MKIACFVQIGQFLSIFSFPSNIFYCSLSSPFQTSLKLTVSLSKNLHFYIISTLIFKKKVWVFSFSLHSSCFESCLLKKKKKKSLQTMFSLSFIFSASKHFSLKPIQTKTLSFSLYSYIHVILRTPATKTTTRTQQQEEDESSKPQSKKAAKKEAAKLEKPKRRQEATVAIDVAFDEGSARQQLRRHSNFGPLVEGCSRY